MTELRMPDEFKGQSLTGNEYTTTKPREWTDQELAWCLEHFQNGVSAARLAEATGRSLTSVKMKLKKFSKKADDYNTADRDKKYAANELFRQLIAPGSVLDVYAGNSWWTGQADQVVTNDKDERFDTDYHLQARHLVMSMELAGAKFDVVDLDPYGSAYECFDSAIAIAQKGLVVSFGEWGHRRFKRLDFVRDRYGMASIDDFSIENLIAEVQRIGRTHKKYLEPVDVLKYRHFLRVYFTIQRHKITEQWEQEGNNNASN